VEKDDCANTAKKYKVKCTPTAIYFDSAGKERKRVPIANKSWGQIKQYLGKLPGNGMR
jgi:thioredoxin-related protein